MSDPKEVEAGGVTYVFDDEPRADAPHLWKERALALEAENKRLREGLERIFTAYLDSDPDDGGWAMREIARELLGLPEGTNTLTHGEDQTP